LKKWGRFTLERNQARTPGADRFPQSINEIRGFRAWGKGKKSIFACEKSAPAGNAGAHRLVTADARRDDLTIPVHEKNFPYCCAIGVTGGAWAERRFAVPRQGVSCAR